MPTPRPHRFSRFQRVRFARTFRLVYTQGRVKHDAVLAIHVHPNGTDDTRLGLSVPRRVGNAVVRNRIKRRLREAFRHERPSLPQGYDVVVNVRPHAPLPVSVYREKLVAALRSLDQAWKNAPSKPAGDDASPPAP